MYAEPVNSVVVNWYAPNPTYRHVDTIYTGVTVSRTETGGYVARGIPHPASDFEAP